MKHILKVVTFLLFLAVAVQVQVVQAQAAPKTWALLVGVGTYQNPQISSLDFAANDAISLRDAFLNKEYGNLPREQVKFLGDNEATRDNIMGTVQGFFKANMKDGDKVVVFMAGHGVAKGVGVAAKSYFLPHDTKGLTTASLENSAVDLRAFANALGALPASQFVVFVDACREDPTPGRGIKGNELSDVVSRDLTIVPQDEKSESATFFACSVGERAYEDPKLGHGVFTKWILEGLTKGDVPQKNGDVEMSVLSPYVSQKVAEWAKNTSEAGDFEVVQTPELVTAKPLKDSLVFLKVNRPITAAPQTAAAPKLLAMARPESARAVETLDANDPAVKFYTKAANAEARQQWEVAEVSYRAAIEANPKFVPAYEALGELHRLQNLNADAVADALNLLNNVSDAHTLSLLSRAYSRVAENGIGNNKTVPTMAAVNKYTVVRDAKGALPQAVRAAKEALDAAQKALAADKTSAEAKKNLAEAYRAQGYALAALDAKGINKDLALKAFGNAVFRGETDAANHLALGYGIRFYGAREKNEADKKTEFERAIASLDEAVKDETVKLRSDYYDAYSELAFCHATLGNTEKALHFCKMANANRGAASSIAEIAALDVTAAGMHQKAAENSTGDKKERHQKASAGYEADAREHDPDLKLAMSILNSIGVSTSIYSYLPSAIRSLAIDPKAAIKDKIRDKLGGFNPF